MSFRAWFNVRLMPVFFLLILITPSVFADSLCGLLLTQSKIEKVENNWSFLNETSGSEHFLWLKKPLSETLEKLPDSKKKKLVRLLESFNPEIDFLYMRNSEFFVHQVVELLEGPVASGRSITPTGKRNALTRIAAQQLWSQGIVEATKALAPTAPGLWGKTRRFMSRFQNHPVSMLLNLPPSLPFWRKTALEPSIVESLIERRWEHDLSEVETLVLNNSVPRNRYNRLRRMGKIVIMGTLAFILASEVRETYEVTSQALEESRQEQLLQYQETKSGELEQVNGELQGLLAEKQAMATDPESYFYDLLVKEFSRDQGRVPSPSELTQLQSLAMQISEEQR